MIKKRGKKVYMYNIDGKMVKEFETTRDCARFFGKKPEYINHSLTYYGKIRKNGEWYVISRV